MNPDRSVSKILDALDMAISAIGGPAPEVFGHHWTPGKGLVSNANPLGGNTIGHFGHFGHHQRANTGFDSQRHDEKSISDSNGGVARKVLFSSVQDVQGVQSPATPGFGVGHLCPSGVQSVQKPCGSEKAEGHGLNGSPTDLRAAFEERAAIAEFEGGLDRDAAERLAWAEVTGSLEGLAQPEQLHTGPAGDDAVAWRAWMRSRISVSRARGLTTADAVRSVWSEAEDRWHRQHGATPDPDRCAGCGEWMLDGPGMTFDDGAVVHFGNPDRLDCLIIYGEAWRAAASAGLVVLGLRKPQP
jgi:hypothetical protein